jgi:TatD DNase family protein
MFIDTHAHLFYLDFDIDIVDVIKRARDVGVQYFIVPGTNLETSKKAIELSERFDNVYVCVGFHPLDLEQYTQSSLSEIQALTNHKKVVAIGEIGIDYFYDSSPREFQKEVFTQQILLAIQCNLPIVVHTRDSVDDAVKIAIDLAQSNQQWNANGWRGVFHCFTGNTQAAQLLRDNKFLVSYPGVVTFKKTTLLDTVREIGYQNIMLETDSPFLAPAPHRGKRNEPCNIPIIAKKIAEVCGTTVENVAAATTANAKKIFNIP